MAEGVKVAVQRENLTLRPYRQGDEEGILALFKRAYNRERSLAHWQWKFCQNPAGQQIILAVTGSGEIVGQFAGLPTWASKNGRAFLLSQAVDSMVDVRYRRGLKNPGLQVMLVRRFFQEYMGSGAGALAYGFPTAVYSRLLIRTGVGTVLHRIVELKRGLFGWSGDLRKLSASLRYQIKRVSRFPSTVDRLWEQCREELPFAIIRDARYLNWRYAQCPDVQYVKLLATERWTGQAAGVAVLRLGYGARPVALLVDWLALGQPQNLAEALLQHCHAIATDSGQIRIKAWFPEYSHHFQFLKSNGYRATVTPRELAVQAFHTELYPEWIRGHWYYTMGDSDHC
ncbi:MAG: GNAT family N-acetyltransferase [Candidatus Methylomirabilis oxyfera]|nr:GNAT family N-acetyltransferase [Candidatus Methylomirabilis oxyfera]